MFLFFASFMSFAFLESTGKLVPANSAADKVAHAALDVAENAFLVGFQHLVRNHVRYNCFVTRFLL